ncbi:MAG: branched-chain amino acid ABC transporter permease [Chloroflexi bacterium]|nr:branched-chain amino acid ABC transporter permease [Chloroflexota bacterium]
MQTLRRIPTWISTLLVALFLFVFVYVANANGWITPYVYNVIQLAGISAISALGLNLIYGFNGQFSLGHIGFYAIGAYSSALITKEFTSRWSGTQFSALSWIIAGILGVILVILVIKRLRFDQIKKWLNSTLGELKGFERWILISLILLVIAAVIIVLGVAASWVLQKGLQALFDLLIPALPEAIGKNVLMLLALLAGGSLAALVAYLVGLPLLRLNSDYFGIATLGFAIVVYTLLQNSDLVIATMKGARGMVEIPRWTNWVWVAAVLSVLVFLLRNLVYSSYGRAIVSVREDEIAAKTMGIDIVQSKTLAFAIGGFYAGIAGGLYAHLVGFLHPSTFDFVRGFDPLIIIVFGGLGSMTGTLVASALFSAIIEGLRVILPQGFEDWRFVIYPILLLIIMLLRQQGLLGTTEWGWLRAPYAPIRDVPMVSGINSVNREVA